MAGFWSDAWGPGVLDRHRRALVALALALIGVAASAVIVPETEQAIIVRLGQPTRVINAFDPRTGPGRHSGAGLHWRVPLLDQVVWVDRRALGLALDRQQVTTSDRHRLVIEAFVRLRIVDAVRLYTSTGGVERLGAQLRPVFDVVLRDELGRNDFATVVAGGPPDGQDTIRRALDRAAQAYGVNVIDVRITRTELPFGPPRDAALARMAAIASQEAAAIRADGSRDAQRICAEAQAAAARTYAKSFGKDPDFYDFYRAMQSYDATFAKTASQTTIILGPDNDWLRQFRGAGGPLHPGRVRAASGRTGR